MLGEQQPLKLYGAGSNPVLSARQRYVSCSRNYVRGYHVPLAVLQEGGTYT